MYLSGSTTSIYKYPINTLYINKRRLYERIIYISFIRLLLIPCKWLFITFKINKSFLRGIYSIKAIMCRERNILSVGMWYLSQQG